MVRSLIIFGCFTALSGCSALPGATGNNSQVSPRIAQLDQESEKLLRSIESSLLIIAETRQGRVELNSTPEEMADREWLFREVPAGMGIPVTFNSWNGHPAVMLDMIASFTGYTIENIGSPSATVRNVKVSVLSRPAVEVLRSVAFQMGCDGLVDPQSANRKLVIDWSVRKRGACK